MKDLVESLYLLSRYEPHIAYGIMLPVSSSIKIFADNVTWLPNQVNKGQILVFLHFVPENKIQSFAEFGDFAKFELDEPRTVNSLSLNYQRN